MKNNILIAAALAFSVNAIAQNSLPEKDEPRSVICSTLNTPGTNETGKVTCVVQQVTDPVSTPAEAVAKDCFKMIDKQMYAMKGGHAFVMTNTAYLQNGTVILATGKILTNAGTKIYLQNGESIDGDGLITTTRCAEFAASSLKAGGTCIVQ